MIPWLCVVAFAADPAAVAPSPDDDDAPPVEVPSDDPLTGYVARQETALALRMQADPTAAVRAYLNQRVSFDGARPVTAAAGPIATETLLARASDVALTRVYRHRLVGERLVWRGMDWAGVGVGVIGAWALLENVDTVYTMHPYIADLPSPRALGIVVPVGMIGAGTAALVLGHFGSAQSRRDDMDPTQVYTGPQLQTLASEYDSGVRSEIARVYGVSIDVFGDAPGVRVQGGF